MKGGRSSWEECVFFIPFCKWLPYGIIWYVYVVLLPISLNAIRCVITYMYNSKAVFLNYYDFKMQHFSYIWSDVEIWLSRVTPTWNVRTRRYVYKHIWETHITIKIIRIKSQQIWHWISIDIQNFFGHSDLPFILQIFLKMLKIF